MTETTGSKTSGKSVFSDALKAEARQLGFDLVGIAPAVTPTGLNEFKQWLERGYAGEMWYLKRRETAYDNPGYVMDCVKSVVMLAINYCTKHSPSHDAMQGIVSRYAWGRRDYHDVLRDKLRQLADFVRSQRPDCRTRGIVDTAPLLERDFARLAGLGWFGKNTMLINKGVGSWLFLAALLVDVELEYDKPHESSHCGTCTRCLDACPTNAFPEPYVLDARKCISYLTIELRDAPIPSELRAGLGQWVFGCDICQDVCPWNRKAPISQESAFQPVPGLAELDIVKLLELTEDGFRDRFRQSALLRPRRAGLLRNAAIALGNSCDVRAVPVLINALDDDDPLVRGAVVWALGRLGSESAMAALQSRLQVEDNADVQTELEAALTS